MPRVRPPHPARPRFLPQGGGGDDTLTATGSVERLRGEGGAGDSCTLNGVTKTAGDGSKFSGCEQPKVPTAEPTSKPTAEPSTAAPTSDSRMKQDIVKLGHSPSGIPIYRFKYKEAFDPDRSGATYVGTMAQDLLETHPTAVITGDDGFYRVNYDQIDVNMTRLA